MDAKVAELYQQLENLKEQFATIQGAHSALKKDLERINSLYSLASELTSINDIDHLLVYLKQRLVELLELDGLIIHIHDTEYDDFHQIIHGFAKEPKKENGFWQNETILNTAVERRQRLLISDIASSDYEPRLLPGSWQTGSLLCLPLTTESETLLGVLVFYRSRANSYDKDDLDYIDSMAGQLAKHVNQVLIHERIKQLSIKDELTGLFNRRYFNQRYERELQRAKRYQRTVAIIMLDIDHFKEYNDKNGHLMGDQVLKNVAALLEGNLRKSDVVARFGGEEFVIMLPEISKNQAMKVANKLRRRIEKTKFPDEASQPNGKITVSLGLAVYPFDSENPETLLKIADDALYAAKSMGRNHVAWHGMKTVSTSKTPRTKSDAQPSDRAC